MAKKPDKKAADPRPVVCRKCDSRCCRYVSFDIPEPVTRADFENVRWFLMHSGFTVHINEGGDWYMIIEHHCGELDENNLCKHYSRRPLVCRQYKVETCEFTQGDHEGSLVFRTVEEFERYARKQLAANKRAKRPRGKGD